MAEAAAAIGYGVLTDREGRPVAMEVYSENREDPSTVADLVVKVRARFGLQKVFP